MPSDALIQLQSLTTKTATFTTATPVVLPGGTSRRGLKARVIYSAATNASGSNAVIFSIDVSRDGGSTFLNEFQSDPINLSTTSQSGEIFISFEVSPSSVVNGVQIRLSANFSGAGSTPTIQYAGDLLLARP